MPGYKYRGTQPWTPEMVVKKKKRSSKFMSPCGTRAAYDRHVRNQEDVDDACFEAYEVFKAEYREKKRLEKLAKREKQSV